MASTSPDEVASGFFRVHAYVLLGLFSLAAVVSAAVPGAQVAPAVVGAVVSYAAAAAMLYERAGWGRGLLCAAAITGCWCVVAPSGDVSSLDWRPAAAGLTSGLLVGALLTAMLLGHWYLNAPGMRLAPLRRLLLLTAAAIVARAALSAESLAAAGVELTWGWEASFLALRWLAGVVGPAAAVWLAWRTLEIPNTQSATGILYAGLIVLLLGELTSLMLGQSLGQPV